MGTHEPGDDALGAENPVAEDAGVHIQEPHAQNPIALYEQLHALLDQLDEVDTTTAPEAEVAAMAIEHERAVRRMISIGNDRIMDVSDRAAYRSVGVISLRDFMMGPLRIPNAYKRMRTMEAVCETYTITGDKKPPVYPPVSYTHLRAHET